MNHPIPGARAAWRLPRLLCGGLLALLALTFLNGTTTSQPGPTKGDEKGSSPPSNVPVEPPTLEVRFTDNSLMKLALKTDNVTLVTRYGSLTIPLTEVVKIDFATRIPHPVAKQIDAAIKSLSSSEFKERERARAELTKLGSHAYPALLEAAKSEDPEVKRAVEEIINKIKDSVPEEQLVVRLHDIIHTKDSKFTGKIETTLFKANTLPFGEVPVRLADMRGLRSLSFVEPDTEKLVTIADPGSLQGYANQYGTKLAITVTGRVDGAIWGTNVYTLDTTLATAAVHAGVLQIGQTGVVKVQIVQSPQNFISTTQNGVTSQPWNVYPGGAYQILKPAR